MVVKCREIEIVIKGGNFVHTTHDYFGETCEELKNIILKFIDKFNKRIWHFFNYSRHKLLVSFYILINFE